MTIARGTIVSTDIFRYLCVCVFHVFIWGRRQEGNRMREKTRNRQPAKFPFQTGSAAIVTAGSPKGHIELVLIGEKSAKPLESLQ